MLDRPILHKFNQSYDHDSFEQQRINAFIRVSNLASDCNPYLSPITVTEDQEEPGGIRYETDLYYLDFQITEEGEFTVQLEWKGEPLDEHLYFEILPDHFECRRDIRDSNNKPIDNVLIYTF